MAEIDTSDTTFEKDVIDKSNQLPVLVDFYADWCPPCQILKPILESIATSDEYKDKFLLAKLESEKNPKKPVEYQVMSFPTIKLFKQGKITAEFVGAKPEEEVKSWLNQNL